MERLPVRRRPAASAQAERRGLGHGAATEVGARNVVRVHPPAVGDAHAAAPLPGACAVRPIFQLFEEIRIDQLVQLGIGRAQTAQTDHGPDVVPAVETGRRPAAALAQKMDLAERPTGARIHPRGSRGAPPPPRGLHALGHRLRQRQPAGFGDRLAGQHRTRGRGRRFDRVQHAAARRHDGHRPHGTRVMRKVRVHDREQGQIRGRGGVGERTVDVARHLAVGPGIIERDRVVVHVHLHPNRHAPVVDDAVVVDAAFRDVAPVGDRTDFRTHVPFRGIQQRRDGPLDRGRAVSTDQRRKVTLAHTRGPDQAVQVALHQKPQPDVGDDHLPHAPVALTPRVQFGGRDAQPLVPHVARLRVIPRGAPAAGVGLMALGDRPETQHPIDEHRLGDREIRRMIIAVVGVVQHEDVALVRIVGVRLRNGAHRPGRRRQQNRDVRGLGDQAQVAVVHRGHEIARLAENGRTRGAQHGLPHLLGDRVEPVRNHRQQDGVEAFGRHGGSGAIRGRPIVGDRTGARQAAGRPRA